MAEGALGAREERPRGGARAERTRATLLEAAESIFAERGFAATRLEDVAERVGIRRASIVYHFRDKRELYGAVLDELVQGLYEPVERALDQGGPLGDRVEGAVSVFVDFIAERPSAARILLREIADGSPDNPPQLVRHLAVSFTPLVLRVRGVGQRARRYPKADPTQIASAIAGTTIFQLAAVPTLAPGLDYDPREPERLEALRAQVMGLARGLLGEHSGVEE